MHIHIGKDTLNDCKVTLEDGQDVTSKLHIRRISVDLVAHQMTLVTLECYASIDVEVSESRLVVREPRRTHTGVLSDSTVDIETVEP